MFISNRDKSLHQHSHTYTTSTVAVLLANWFSLLGNTFPDSMKKSSINWIEYLARVSQQSTMEVWLDQPENQQSQIGKVSKLSSKTSNAAEKQRITPMQRRVQLVKIYRTQIETDSLLCDKACHGAIHSGRPNGLRGSQFDVKETLNSVRKISANSVQPEIEDFGGLQHEYATGINFGQLTIDHQTLGKLDVCESLSNCRDSLLRVNRTSKAFLTRIHANYQSEFNCNQLDILPALSWILQAHNVSNLQLLLNYIQVFKSVIYCAIKVRLFVIVTLLQKYNKIVNTVQVRKQQSEIVEQKLNLKNNTITVSNLERREEMFALGQGQAAEEEWAQPFNMEGGMDEDELEQGVPDFGESGDEDDEFFRRMNQGSCEGYDEEYHIPPCISPLPYYRPNDGVFVPEAFEGQQPQPNILNVWANEAIVDHDDMAALIEEIHDENLPFPAPPPLVDLNLENDIFNQIHFFINPHPAHAG